MLYAGDVMGLFRKRRGHMIKRRGVVRLMAAAQESKQKGRGHINILTEG
jgi:hypothetical protein